MPSRTVRKANVRKRTADQRVREARQAGKTYGLIIALQFAEMVAKRIVEMGGNLTPSIIAQVATPLGLRPMFVEDAPLPLPRAKGGKQK